MHIHEKDTLDRIVASIAEMDDLQLDRIQRAIDDRRHATRQSTVLERRDHRHGILQLEGRAYRRKKDGGRTGRGPYWYFHYREGGRQCTLYVGKTGCPEAAVDKKLEKE